ncbi:PASTA domain-containing protein [Flavobacterium sp. U410]|jgi:beta-lactam-binding protein with PASTA domain
MSLRKFLTSKVFFIQLAIALGIIVVLVILVMNLLSFKTNHGEEIKVPDLSKMQLKIAEEKLKELDLELILLDTVDFHPDMPPFSIVEQDPKAGNSVKSGRKIYIKLNSGEYDDITIPDFKEKTYRQMSANLKSLGVQEGSKTYRKSIAKDVVLQLMQNGKKLKKGDKVKKNSKIDFVLGDGKAMFDGTNIHSDTTQNDNPEIEQPNE